MSLFHSVFGDIKRKMERAESGQTNCIPCEFSRFSEYWPGIEQQQYYGVSANSKIGKTHITDNMFLYNPIKHVSRTETDIDVRILYFSLETSREEKVMQVMSHFLYNDSGGKICVSPRELRSVKKALNKDVYYMIKKYDSFFEGYLSKVTYFDNVRSRNHIMNIINKESEYYGKFVKDEKGNNKYVLNNPNLYLIIIVDHLSLLIPEAGETLKQTMDTFSSQQLVPLRNMTGFIPVVVQQQAASQESVENIKYDLMKPSFNGLAETKLTARDWNMGFGLFAPHKYNQKTYNGYATNDNFRVLNIMGGRESPGLYECPLYFNGAVSEFRELEKLI